MKRRILGIIAVIAMVGLTACGNKPEVKPVQETNNNGVIENVPSSNNNTGNESTVNTPEVKDEANELKAAKESLINGGEWKPTSGIASQSENGEITEYSAEGIYGKYAGVGGATFHEDGTFTKFVGVYDGEEIADKTGTYTIDTATHTITFKYSKGSEVVANYEHSNDGKVLYFNYPEEDFNVRFDPTNTLLLKDNIEEAKYQIELAMKNNIKETYGDDVVDSKVYIQNIYSYADEEEVEVLKDMNLNANEVAFEVKYDLKPASGVDVMKFTIGNGEYDEASGWVKNKFNVGVIRPSDKGNNKYELTDLGTGW